MVPPLPVSRIMEVIEPVARLMPYHHPNAADINEALDYGVASCAVRAYAAGLLLRDAYPNDDIYQIEFGFAPEHPILQGRFTLMGHAVCKLWIPEKPEVIIESYENATLEVTSPSVEHQDYLWYELQEGYQEYLDRADLELDVDPYEVLRILQTK